MKILFSFIFIRQYNLSARNLCKMQKQNITKHLITDINTSNGNASAINLSVETKLHNIQLLWCRRTHTRDFGFSSGSKKFVFDREYDSRFTSMCTPEMLEEQDRVRTSGTSSH